MIVHHSLGIMLADATYAIFRCCFDLLNTSALIKVYLINVSHVLKYKFVNMLAGYSSSQVE